MPIEPSYIHFLDSDDYLELDCIEECVKVVRDNPEVEIVWHGNQMYYEREQEKRIILLDEQVDLVPNHLYSGEEILQKVKSLGFSWVAYGIVSLSFLVRQNICFMQSDMIAEDAVFGMQIFSFAHQVYLLNLALYTYRIRANSISQYEISTSPHQTTFPKYYQDIASCFTDVSETWLYIFVASRCESCLQMIDFIQRNQGALNLGVISMLNQMIAYRAKAAFWIFGFEKDPRSIKQKCRIIYSYLNGKIGYKNKIAYLFPKTFLLMKKIKKRFKSL